MVTIIKKYLFALRKGHPSYHTLMNNPENATTQKLSPAKGRHQLWNKPHALLSNKKEKQIKRVMHKIQVNITKKPGICFILCLKKNFIIAKVIFCKRGNATIMAAKAIAGAWHILLCVLSSNKRSNNGNSLINLNRSLTGKAHWYT